MGQISQQTVLVPIGPTFATVFEAAALRVAYLHADWVLTWDATAIKITGPAGVDPADIRREIAYALYRERILAETMDMRRGLLALVQR